MDYNVQEIDDIWSEYFTEIKGNQISKDESKICKNCKNDRFNIINGDLMCTCGFIIESRVVSDEPEWNNYVEDGVMNGSGIRCGNVLDITNPYDTGSTFIPKYMWSWHLDENGVKRYTNLSKIALFVAEFALT